jgi:hypothetical protein
MHRILALKRTGGAKITDNKVLALVYTYLILSKDKALERTGSAK